MRSARNFRFCVLLTFVLSQAAAQVIDNSILELSCDQNSDCLQFKFEGFNVTCLDSKCVCNDLNGQFVTCKPKDSKINNIIGGSCPCPQADSECNVEENICYCRKEYVATPDKRRCVKKIVPIGEKCEDDAQCITATRFSECDLQRKICTCQKNFIEFHGICMSVVALGETCLNDLQCQNHTANTVCFGHKCVCASDFVASFDNAKCLPSAGYNDLCSETNQCKYKMGAGAECYSGFCSCDHRHYLSVVGENEATKTHICELRVELGQYCREHNHCYQYHLKADEQPMVCRFGECTCRKGFHQWEIDCVKDAAAKHLVSFSASLLFVLIYFGIRNSF